MFVCLCVCFGGGGNIGGEGWWSRSEDTVTVTEAERGCSMV